MSEPRVMGNDGPATGGRKPWPLATRIGFRFCFCYMMLYVFFNGNVTPVSVIDGSPLSSGMISKPLFVPFARLSSSLGRRIFHISGVADTWHGGGSGDTALNWVLIFSFFAISMLATLIWSALDHRRKNYDALHAWLRFAIRMMLGASMIFYALVKVFPFQMLPITAGQLNEPLGQLAPMTMLWSLIGMSPLYQTICGVAELAAGVLIMIRRTALAGALLTLFVMSNVLLYNLFFDVPVKIFAAHLVLLALFLILPDVPPLWKFFVTHKPSETAGVWIPRTSHRALQLAISIFEVCFVLVCLGVFTTFWHGRWVAYRASLSPAPIFGVWSVKQSGPGLINTPEGKPWTAIYIDNTYRALVRDCSGQLWRTSLKYNAKGTLDITGPTETVSFAWKQIDPAHLALTETKFTPRLPLYGRQGDSTDAVPALLKRDQGDVLMLERQPVPSSYPLLDRGFHFVTEWTYER